uniref:Neurotransmitter-gated ion-channel ligand-binding domain-containing protein n=1 Tax=Anopheles melas TaxID=34690 RepID=A0A182TXC0_9DIPT
MSAKAFNGNQQLSTHEESLPFNLLPEPLAPSIEPCKEIDNFLKLHHTLESSESTTIAELNGSGNDDSFLPNDLCYDQSSQFTTQTQLSYPFEDAQSFTSGEFLDPFYEQLYSTYETHPPDRDLILRSCSSEGKATLYLNVWMSSSWKDEYLNWDRAEYSLDKVVIDSDDLWRPTFVAFHK